MIRMRIKLTESKPADVSRDAWRDVCRRGFAHIGRIWFEKFFPNHFTPQARYQYDHKPRSNKYKERKRRLAARGIGALGGAVDNVFTGRLMRELKGGATIRGFPTRGRVEMRGPNYLRMNFRAKSNQPDKKRELVTLTESESRYLLEEFKRFVTREYKKVRRPKTTTIGA